MLTFETSSVQGAEAIVEKLGVRQSLHFTTRNKSLEH
jgi:hypothetical protein